VRRFTAVLKQANTRSLRLLQRLGFRHAATPVHLGHEVERDEWLMQRDLDP
jgi:L-amino acid N-acyltransferase YncA